MAIKAILDTLDGVDEATKAFYAEDDGKFVLDVAKYSAAQVDEATKGLKGKVDELLGESKAAKAKAKEEAEAKAKAEEEAAKKSGDVEALEKSWGEKLTKAVEGKDAENAELRKTVDNLTVGAAAKDVAAELAVQGSASVLERIVRDRLSVEMTDNGPLIRVNDSQGQPSAANLEDLKTELSNDEALKPLIAASKASGGGAPNANGGAGKSNGLAGDIAAKVPGFSSLPKS
ncbi:hypothetical protein [uncultured Ruegeria sp.]|uniref:hypothetical protein n=1 Tax=uncultured Ruegeria sp. TaxID=259304 RepID=UPI002615E838|nr:hypothetical protein [uncultured Ruegeria sp.]